MGIDFLGAVWTDLASKGTSFHQKDRNEQIGNPSKRVDFNHEIENILLSIAPIKAPILPCTLN